MRGENGMQEGARRRALVVDDSLVARMMASTMLARRDFEVVEAEDGAEALRRLQEDCFDLVLMDIGMPGMSGFELCHILRLEMGMVDLPILAYTAHGQVTEIARMRLAGFNDFLIKPMTQLALDRALSQTLEH